MKKALFAFTLLTLTFSCNQKEKKEVEKNNVANNELTEKLNTAFQKGLIKGFSVAVVNENGIQYENGFGYADIDTTKNYTSSTVQPIASISKTLIGLSLIKAEELKLLNLNDPINKHLPFEVINPNHPDKDILVKHLAYHTSSIIDTEEVYFNNYFLENEKKGPFEDHYDFFRSPNEKISLEQYLTNALSKNGELYSENVFSSNAPGELRDYSNIGADLCAFIIEYTSGKDFRDFTYEHITKPLKMNSSGWEFKDVDEKKESRLFANTELMISKYSQSSYPNGQFITSSRDLGLYLTELIRGYNGKGIILSQNGYKKLFATQKFEDKQYGCFLEFTDEWLAISDNMIGHNGSDFGVFTGMYFNLERNTGKIMISNTDTDFDDDIVLWPEIQEIWKSLIEYEIEIEKKKASR